MVRTHPVFGPAGALRATKFVPDEFVEPSTLRVRGFSPGLVRQIQKNPH
jgi:hypothetical protein